MDWYLACFLLHCYQLTATELYWGYVNTGSGNGLVLPGNKPLPGPVLAKLSVAIWYPLFNIWGCMFSLYPISSWWLREYIALPYYHHQIRSMNYYPLGYNELINTYLYSDKFSLNQMSIFSPRSWLWYLYGSPHLDCNNIVFCPIMVLSHHPNGNWHEVEEIIIWNQ